MIYLNGRKLNIERFSNGEIAIRNYIDITKINVIELKFESNEDLMNLMFIKRNIDDQSPLCETRLIMPYLPYCRMDRTEGVNVFTLKYICEFINSLNFSSVLIYEPHSDVGIALLDRVKVVNQSAKILNDVIKDLDFDGNKDYIFFPDAGAEKRYSKQISWENILSAQKERDFLSGRIKKLTIVGDKPKEPFRVIIVDDLCSRGGTFMMAAEKLRELGATKIYLVVTHCENTIFEGDILRTDAIDKVYTTDSILDNSIDEEKIEIYKIFN